MKILNAGTKYISRFLLEYAEKEYLLIDTGYKWEYAAFLKKLAELGVKKEEIKYVAITHAHADHVGFLKEMMADVDIKVIYHPDQGPRLRAGKNDCNVFISNFPVLLSSKIVTMSPFIEKSQCYPSLDTSTFISYEDNPLADYGIEFIPLRGHTAADLCIKVGSDFFCGDVFGNAIFSTHRFPTWIEDKFALIRSWEQVLEIKDIATIYPGHGKPFSSKVLPKDLEYWKDKGVFTFQKKRRNQLDF